MRSDIAGLVCVALAGLVAPAARGQGEQAIFDGVSPNGMTLGWSAALDGDTAAVGAPGRHSNTPGYVHMFRRTGSTWTAMQVLSAAGAKGGDWLGSDVALDGNVLVAGAWGTSDGTDFQPGVHRGSVVVYRRPDGLSPWVEEVRLQPASVLEHDRFGGSVAVEGPLIVVGTPGADDLGSQSGAVYVFRDTAGSWVQEARLTAFDGAAEQRFGGDVALWGDTVVIGASGSEETGPFTGAAYVYRHDGAAWQLEARLAPAGLARDSRFSEALDLEGDVLAVAAPREAVDGVPKAGTVRIFRRSGGRWAEEALLRAATPVLTDNFGTALDLDANQVLVGVPGADLLGGLSGRVDRFVLSGGAWAPAGILFGSLADFGDEFGRSVALDDEHAVVGSPHTLLSGGGPDGRVYTFGGLVGGGP